MGCDAAAIATALRVSFCADNDEADVDALLAALRTGLATHVVIDEATAARVLEV